MVLKLFKCLATLEAPSFFPAIADSSDALQAAAVAAGKEKGDTESEFPFRMTRNSEQREKRAKKAKKWRSAIKGRPTMETTTAMATTTANA